MQVTLLRNAVQKLLYEPQEKDSAQNFVSDFPCVRKAVTHLVLLLDKFTAELKYTTVYNVHFVNCLQFTLVLCIMKYRTTQI